MPDQPTDPDRARDLRADLATCAAATKPPWTPTICSDRDYKDGTFGRFYFPTFEEAPFTDFIGDSQARAEAQARLDAAFLCSARQGWPASLRRALAAEAEVERLRAALLQAYPVLHYYGRKPGEQCINQESGWEAAASALEAAKAALGNAAPDPHRCRCGHGLEDHARGQWRPYWFCEASGCDCDEFQTDWGGQGR